MTSYENHCAFGLAVFSTQNHSAFSPFCVIITAAERRYERKKRSAIHVWPALQNRNHNKWHQATTWSKIKHKIVRWMQDKSAKFSFRCCEEKKQTPRWKNSRWEENINIIIDILSAARVLHRSLKNKCAWILDTIEIRRMMLFPAFACLAAPWNMKWFVVLVGRQRETSSFVQDEISRFCRNICVLKASTSKLFAPSRSRRRWFEYTKKERETKQLKLNRFCFLRNGPKAVFVCLSDRVDNDISKNIQSRLRCWESSVLYFLLPLRVLLFYLTFFVVSKFDTQKWRNKEMAIVSGAKFGSIIGEWLNGRGGETPLKRAKTALWLRKKSDDGGNLNLNENCEKLFSINVRDSLKVYKEADIKNESRRVYER